MTTPMAVFASLVSSVRQASAADLAIVQAAVVEQLKSHGFLVGDSRPGLLKLYRRGEPWWVALRPEQEAEADRLNAGEA
jgi:hypothetical protein